jgi:membrane dipeptidase
MGVISALVDRAVNRTARRDLAAGPAARALHQNSPIVDLVVGSALFRRGFIDGSRRGHADLPRLRAAGVNVIGLTVATRFPDLRGRLSNIHFRSLGMAPWRAASDLAIAEWVIDRIHRWCAGSAGRLRLIEEPADLAAALAPGGPVGVFIGVQGGHALDGAVDNVARLRRQGVLMLAPAHVMDNALVGSGTGRHGGGLTGYGREVIAAAQEAGMIVDLAHMSLAGIEQTLPLLRPPFALSHSGLTEIAGRSSRWRRYSPARRNIPTSVAAEVGLAGGIVGVVLSTQLLGGSTLDDAAATIERALAAAGAEQVALGSDMDGALRMVVDVAGLPALTDTLLRRGMTRPTVEGVMGRNAVRLLERALAQPG